LRIFNNYINSLDPRTKIVIFTALFILPFIIKDLVYLLLLSLIPFLLILFGENIKRYLKLILRSLPMFIIAFIMWSLFHEWSLFHKEYFGSGFLVGAYMTIRLFIIISSSIAFIMLIKPEEIIKALEAFNIPYTITLPLTLSLRSIDALTNVYSTIKESLISRGLDLESRSLLKAIRNYSYALILLFIRSVEMAEDLVLAMELKGFSLRTKRVKKVKLRFRLIDVIIISLTISVSIISVLHYIVGMI